MENYNEQSNGYPMQAQLQYQQPCAEEGQPRVSAARNVLGLVGMICGIIGLTLFWYPIFGLAHPIAGLVLSKLGKKKYPPKFANIGWKLSLIGVILAGVAVIVWIIWFIVSLNSHHSYYYDTFY